MTEKEILNDIKSKMDSLIVTTEDNTEKLKNVGISVIEVKRLLNGPLGEPEKGMVIKVDRNTESIKKRDKIFLVVIGAIISGIVTLALSGNVNGKKQTPKTQERTLPS